MALFTAVSSLLPRQGWGGFDRILSEIATAVNDSSEVAAPNSKLKSASPQEEAPGPTMPNAASIDSVGAMGCEMDPVPVDAKVVSEPYENDIRVPWPHTCSSYLALTGGYRAVGVPQAHARRQPSSAS